MAKEISRRRTLTNVKKQIERLFERSQPCRVFPWWAMLKRASSSAAAVVSGGAEGSPPTEAMASTIMATVYAGWPLEVHAA